MLTTCDNIYIKEKSAANLVMGQIFGFGEIGFDRLKFDSMTASLEKVIKVRSQHCLVSIAGISTGGASSSSSTLIRSPSALNSSIKGIEVDR